MAAREFAQNAKAIKEFVTQIVEEVGNYEQFHTTVLNRRIPTLIEEVGLVSNEGVSTNCH